MFDIVWLRGRVSSSTEYKYKHDQRIPTRGESSVIQTPTLIKQKYKNTNLKNKYLSTFLVVRKLSFSYKMLLNLIILAGKEGLLLSVCFIVGYENHTVGGLMPSTNREL